MPHPHSCTNDFREDRSYVGRLFHAERWKLARPAANSVESDVIDVAVLDDVVISHASSVVSVGVRTVPAKSQDCDI
jgi:hypothetical protein